MLMDSYLKIIYIFQKFFFLNIYISKAINIRDNLLNISNLDSL